MTKTKAKAKAAAAAVDDVDDAAVEVEPIESCERCGTLRVQSLRSLESATFDAPVLGYHMESTPGAPTLWSAFLDGSGAVTEGKAESCGDNHTFHEAERLEPSERIAKAIERASLVDKTFKVGKKGELGELVIVTAKLGVKVVTEKSVKAARSAKVAKAT